jgi:hypothetical protein
MVATFPTLAVSAIFCIWNAYRQARLRRERLLRQRVAYMLWIVATRDMKPKLARARPMSAEKPA